MPIENQVELLRELQPQYLLAYPSNVMLLADYCRAQGSPLPGLREVITYGERLLPEAREAARAAWGVPVADMYSCEEVGYIALQCPEFEHYHCQEESVLVEVLRQDGMPCDPGEIGRVVVTPLHNFAMPLIRYANFDYAEMGDPCPCGRGAAVLKRIVGRERNMAVGPDGKRFWPNLSRSIWSGIAGLQELQLVQTAMGRIEARVVSPEPLTEDDERQLRGRLCSALGQPFDFSFRHQEQIARHANGKYERFICKV
jgi:phenylacetate-CoA ligase